MVNFGASKPRVGGPGPESPGSTTAELMGIFRRVYFKYMPPSVKAVHSYVFWKLLSVN